MVVRLPLLAQISLLVRSSLPPKPTLAPHYLLHPNLSHILRLLLWDLGAQAGDTLTAEGRSGPVAFDT